MTKCKQCGADVPQTQGKQTKVFCTDRCRKAYSRTTPDKIEQSTPDNATPDNSGQCKGCGEEQGTNLIDICYKCIAKGITRKSIGLKPTDRQIWLNECLEN